MTKPLKLLRKYFPASEIIHFKKEFSLKKGVLEVEIIMNILKTQLMILHFALNPSCIYIEIQLSEHG